MTLRGRLLVWLLPPLVLVTLGISVFFTSLTRISETRDAKTHLASHLGQRLDVLHVQFQSLHSLLKMLSTSDNVRSYYMYQAMGVSDYAEDARIKIQTEFQRHVAHIPTLESLHLIDPDGMSAVDIVKGRIQFRHQDFSTQSWYKYSSGDKEFSLFPDPDSDSFSRIWISLQIRDTDPWDGRMIAAEFSPQILLHGSHNTHEAAQHDHPMHLLDRSGRVFASEKSSWLGRELRIDLLKRGLPDPALENLLVHFTDLEGDSSLIYALCSWPREQVLAHSRQIAIVNLLLILVGLAVLMFFITQVSTRFLRPLNLLEASMQQFSDPLNARDLPVDLLKDSSEIGSLSRSYQDLTKRLQERMLELSAREKDLRDSREQLRTLSEALRHSPVAIQILDSQRRIEYANPQYTKMSGYELLHVRGTVPRYLDEDLIEHAVLAEIRSSLDGHRVWRGEYKNIRANGEPYQTEVVIGGLFDSNGHLKQIVAVIKDLTEQRALEAQLRQSQKMESIGHLAGGVAHDFNNLLTVINGYCELLMKQPLDEMTAGCIKEVHSAGRRAARLTSQLLAFSRKQEMQPIPLDPCQLIEDQGRMLERLLGEDIHIQLDLAPGLCMLADPGQLEQIIMNLGVNSRDAMPEGGHLFISLYLEHCEEGECGGNKLPAGEYVCIRLRDTGYGMEAKVLNQIFDPFFTTKGRDKGTGLGLSTVYGIVTQNLGDIQVQSTPGEGTEFLLRFRSHTPEPADC